MAAPTSPPSVCPAAPGDSHGARNKPAQMAIAAALSASHREGRLRSAAAWHGAVNDAEEAYEIQASVAEALNWFPPGAAHVWKSGGASRIDGVTHARLPPASAFPSGCDLRAQAFRKPYIGAEIVLRLRSEVTAQRALQLTKAEAESLIDAMAPAIHIADSRWEEQWDAPWPLRLADAGSHAALVLGEWQPYAPRAWRALSCKVDVGRSAPVEFVGAYGLEDPAWLLPAWLRHATRSGEPVPAGAMVATGSWSGGTACTRGTRASARFDGFGVVEATI